MPRPEPEPAGPDDPAPSGRVGERNARFEPTRTLRRLWSSSTRTRATGAGPSRVPG